MYIQLAGITVRLPILALFEWLTVLSSKSTSILDLCSVVTGARITGIHFHACLRCYNPHILNRRLY